MEPFVDMFNFCMDLVVKICVIVIAVSSIRIADSLEKKR